MNKYYYRLRTSTTLYQRCTLLFECTRHKPYTITSIHTLASSHKAIHPKIGHSFIVHTDLQMLIAIDLCILEKTLKPVARRTQLEIASNTAMRHYAALEVDFSPTSECIFTQCDSTSSQTRNE